LLRMEDALLIHVFKHDDGKRIDFELNVGDYINKSAKPDEFDKLFKDENGLSALFGKHLAQIVPADKEKPKSENKAAPAADSRPVPAYDPFGGSPLLDDRFRPRVPVGGPIGIGDGDSDLNPLGPGLHPLGPGAMRPPSNLIGPDQFGGGGRGRGMRPRFDPFGPAPGLGGEPDFDELPPPGPSGPRLFPFGRGGGGIV